MTFVLVFSLLAAVVCAADDSPKLHAFCTSTSECQTGIMDCSMVCNTDASQCVVNDCAAAGAWPCRTNGCSVDGCVCDQVSGCCSRWSKSASESASGTHTKSASGTHTKSASGTHTKSASGTPTTSKSAFGTPTTSKSAFGTLSASESAFGTLSAPGTRSASATPSAKGAGAASKWPSHSPAPRKQKDNSGVLSSTSSADDGILSSSVAWFLVAGAVILGLVCVASLAVICIFVEHASVSMETKRVRREARRRAIQV